MRLSPPFIILILISLFAFSRCDTSLDITLSSYGINQAGVTYTFGLNAGGTTNILNVPPGSTYKITFPSDYSSIFPSSFTCYDENGVYLGCSRSGLVITVTNLFNQTRSDYYFTVIIKGLTNPSHSSTTGSFTAAISAVTLSASNTVSISTGTSTCSITPTSKVTGATTSWTFTVTTSNAIPALGGLTITPIAKWSFQTDNLLPTSTPTCSVTSPTTATPGNCYVSSSGTVEVRSMTTTAIAAGAVLNITITGFRNPPMTAAYSFTVLTLDANSLGVDSCTPAVTPTTANALTVASGFLIGITNSNLKTVNTYDSCYLTFTTTNPLPASSALSITFPSTVGLGSLTSIVSGSRTLTISVSTSTNIVTISNVVTSYTSGGTAITLKLTNIKNPSTTKPTDSFQIFSSYSGYSIDAITSGATYSAGTGALTSLSVTSSPATVGSSSASMTFSFVIGDALSTAATLSIAFPSELTVATTSSASCTGSGTKIATGPTCSISSSTLSISSFASSALVSGDTITITLNSAVTLPSSAKPTSSFTIQTLDGGYAVDASSSLAFSATAATIVTGSVSIPSGSIVGDVATYTFSFVNVNAIPSTGQIQIAFPTDNSFAISDSTTIAQGVSVTVGTNSATTVSSTVVTASSPNTIAFTNPTSASIAKGTTITFTVPKIRNPLSTASSSSFTLSTLTSDGYAIDMKTTGLALVANTLTAADFYSLTVTLSPSTTGSSSTYKFKLSSTIAQASTNIVQINFPSTFSFASSTTCQVITSSTSGTVSSCTPSSANVFSVTMGQAVSAQTVFEVDISGVINPTAATSYSGFSIYTMISSGYLVNQRTSGISVTVTPSTITTASLSRSTKTLSTAATYTFTFTPVNTYPSTAFIQMTVPTELTLSSSPVCTGISGISTSLTCSVFSTNTNEFNITGSTFYSSSSISFSVATITNQATQTNSSSFTIYVMTAAGLIIDQLTSGLVSPSACDSNCLTCSDSDKTYCLSCPTTGNIYLNVPTHTCVSTCGTGTYLSSDSTQCLACSSNCFTCSGSASTCTSCDSTSTLPYLYNSVCYNACPSGYYADSNNVCQACTSSSNCKTCSSATTCLSCNDNFYLLNGACGTSCDSGYYADSASWTCKTCVNHCLTCNSATVCTGCDTTSSYPILYSSSCLSSCPTGFYQSGYSCIACTSPCATCSGSSYCLTCTEGLYPDNGVCKTCSTSCATCSTSPTSCASCNSGTYLQGTTCVTSCSDGYYLDSGSATCKACSSKCQTCSALNKCTSCDTSSAYPYFYQDGETCVKTCPSTVPRVVNGVCAASNTVAFVNPYSGIYLSGLPFPFIIFGAIFCGLVGIGKIINTNTLVTSNIIGFLGLLEFSTWIAMVILLALSHPGDPVSDYVGLPIVIVAIVTSLILNGFFYWRLVKPQIKSEEYVNWKKAKKSHRISSIVIQTLSCVCFKTFRLVYSRFFGLEFMSAPLDDPKAFLKRLHKYTGINFVISVLPALIAAIITLNEDAGDYTQLLRISVEVLVISLVLMLVSIYDGFKSNKLEENETGITAIIHGQVLSMIEKTVIDKLNESIGSGKVQRPQSKLSAYRRRNSLNLDQSYEYNEANSSFLNLNRTEKILTGVGMKHEESFNESVDGVIGRDAQGNAIRRVNAIQEEGDEDEEPTLNMKNKTLGQLRDMLKDRGHDLEPEKIMIENKDGSVIVLRDKSSYLQNATNMKTSPSKSQVSSIRGTDEEAGRGRMSKFVSEDEEFQKLTGRKGQPSTGRGIKDKPMELDENGRPKYGSPQSNHRVGTQGGKGSEESEEELELHDSYGNLEAKFGKNSLQDSQNHLENLNRGLENLSPIGNMGSRAMVHTPDRTMTHKDMEDDQEEEELEVHSQTPSKTGPRQSGDDNHLRSSPGFAGKPPTGRKGNKSSAKKNPNQQTPGGKNNSKEDFEYVSSDSQLSVEDVHDHFQDDTPSNYDALNQRFDENLYQQQLSNMGKRPDSRATNVSNAQNMSTRSIPKSHLPPVNEIQESHRRSGNQAPVVNNNYFSDGMEDGDLPPVRGKSIESVGSQKNSQSGNTNPNGILQRNKNKVVPFATGGGASERSNSMGKRAMTPQHHVNSRTAQTSSSRGFDTHSNSFSQNKKELNQTVKNFHRAANQRAGGSKVFDSQRERSSSREDTRRPESVDKMKRLEGIYANKVIVPRLNKISSRGSNKVANSRGFIDDDMDNDGLEIHDFGKFESIVNGMKKKETEENESIDK